MKRLPHELCWEVFGWLAGGKDGADARTVCKQWNDIMKRQMVVCCVHEYVDKAMVCKVMYGRKGEPVSQLLARHSLDPSEKGVYEFPHCSPVVYTGRGVIEITNPQPEAVAQYTPTTIDPVTPVDALTCTRLLLNERRVNDPFFGEANSFENYMRLLLRFQVKQQEYALEHHSRTRLLRTYIYNLEHRIACKLRLLLEHISYLCVKYMVALLPYVEASLGSDPTPKDLALRHILFRYRSVQDQVDRECRLVGDGYHAPTKNFKIASLERYANFLCTADDSLEAHVASCKNFQPGTAATKLPDACRLNSEGADEKGEGDGGEECFPPPSDEPTIEAMLQAIITVCSAQRAFVKPELEAAER